MSDSPPRPSPDYDENRDLGFGSVVASSTGRRLLNPDGSFNVSRDGLSWWSSLSLYHTSLTMSWPVFVSIVAALYLALNLLFAVGYALCGAGSLVSQTGAGPRDPTFADEFFFSVETFSTIGYGNIVPTSLSTNLLVTIESLVGLLSVALVTGLVFARFSRPTAAILFSRYAIVAPYRGITAFEFRIANTRRNEIIELQAQVLYARFEDADGRRVRRFDLLTLERRKVTFFPLSWTIVHPIDESSPLFGLSAEDVLAARGEFLVLLTGLDETFLQTVHTRSSYAADQVVWNVKFANLFVRSSDADALSLDVRRIHEYEPVEPAG